MLLNEDVDIKANNKDGWSPLWTAAKGGHAKSVELLTKRGPKINARSNNQCTAPHAAAKREDKHMSELLMEGRYNQFMTALHYACENGQQNIVDYLFQKGANLEVPGNNNSKSPLLCASAMGYLQVSGGISFETKSESEE